MNRYHVTKTYLLMIVFLVWMSGCSDDDKGPSTQNSIQVNGAAFKITTAQLIGVSIDDEGHAGITFTNSDGSLTKSLSIDFEYAPSAGLSGTYSFPVANGNRSLDDWLTTYTEFNGTNAVVSTNLDFGTLTLEDHGKSKYTVTIDLTMTDGKVFRGTYTGTINSNFLNG
jgi:hypothetical protein